MWKFIFFGILMCLEDTLGDCSEKANATSGDYYLFDFSTIEAVNDWLEQSDTVRSVGMSKAVITLNKNVTYQRAVFFSLLNPQPSGSAFAGVRNLGNHNLEGHSQLQIYCRSQGQYQGFKIVLRHKCLNDEPNYTFEQVFEAPKNEFAVRALPLSDFEPYYRGQLVNTTESLDISQISSIGIQAYGGVYLSYKQNGTASLEIDWIKATT